jgi:hypothetical protein
LSSSIPVPKRPVLAGKSAVRLRLAALAAISLALAFVVSMSEALADDLFSKKSLFGDDNLFDDDTVKQQTKVNNAADTAAAAARQERRDAERAAASSMAINDGVLFNQMHTVAGWVDNWIVFNHRFPEIGDETTYALTQLNELVPNNPYKEGSAYVVPGETVDNAYMTNEGEAIAPPPADTKVDSDRIRFVRDYGLTALQIDEYSKDPPPNWRENPGTITVITNDQYLFIIWGAGADGRPLRDFGSKRVRFAVGNYQRWDAPAMDMQVD